jgi:hypothetical protein
MTHEPKTMEERIRELPKDVRLHLAEYAAQQFLDGIEAERARIVEGLEGMKIHIKMSDGIEEVLVKEHNATLSDAIQFIR